MKTAADDGPFSRVPVELFEEIFGLVPRNTLPSLCRVSQQFNLHSLRLLYRDLELSSSSLVIRCSQTLASNLSAASAVKTLKIAYPTPSRPHLGSFYRILAAAFHKLWHLLNLELLVHDLNLLCVLSTSTFPRLHHLECYLPYCPPLTAFLSRHRALNYLHLSPSKHNRRRANELHPHCPLAFTPKVALPKLEYVIASDDCVTAVAHDATLRAVYIEWTDSNQSMQDCISALQCSSSHTLRVLSCRRPGWNLDLVDTISSALPDLFVFSITNVHPLGIPPNYSILESLGKYLSRFTSLRKLIVHSVDFWGFSHPPHHMDRDFTIVRAWGTACPTLAECTLPHGVKWMRVRDHIWFPDPFQREGNAWLARMIHTGQFPEVGTLIDIVEQIVQERMSVLGLNAEFNPDQSREAFARLRALGNQHRCVESEDTGAGTSVLGAGDHSAGGDPTSEMGVFEV